LRRVKKYNPVGRLQTEAESDEYGIRIKELLKSFNVPFTQIDGDLMSADIVVQNVIEKLGGKQLVS